MMNSVIPDSLLAAACELVEQRTGLRVSTQFRTTLQDVLLILPPGDPVTALHHLRQQPESSPLWQTLIHTLTIGETYFFRDAAVFQVLRTHILPQIIATRRQQNDYHVNIWCAGCATGEEPLSAAITLHGLLNDLPRWQINITGTDLNTHALEQARVGVYRSWSFRHTEADFQARYFDQTEAGWLVKPFIHEMVRFEYRNILNTAPQQSYDVVLCRNVLIYFSAHTAIQVLPLLQAALRPGGWLILGHAEALPKPHTGWREYHPHQLTIYQKLPPLPTETASLSPVPPRSHRTTYDEVQHALRAEDMIEAERLLRESLMQKPDPQFHTLLAFILANRHERAAAYDQLDLALHHAPLCADAHYLRAVLLLEEEQPEVAQQTLRSALYCQQDHLLATFLLGWLYLRGGNLARAKRTWEKARQVAGRLPADEYISDLSDLTGASLTHLLNDQIERLDAS